MGHPARHLRYRGGLANAPERATAASHRGPGDQTRQRPAQEPEPADDARHKRENVCHVAEHDRRRYVKSLHEADYDTDQARRALPASASAPAATAIGMSRPARLTTRPTSQPDRIDT